MNTRRPRHAAFDPTPPPWPRAARWIVAASVAGWLALLVAGWLAAPWIIAWRDAL